MSFEIIDSLEAKFSKPLLTLQKFRYNGFGYVITDDKVVGLSLADAAISELPENVFHITSLKYLSLYNNNLSDLPKQISQLKNLEILYLAYNKLQSLPKEIEELEKLQILFLQDNQLATFRDLQFKKTP